MTLTNPFSRYPRKKLANLPTPFHLLANISEEFGCNLYCKRDDLTGFAFGGNKVRKMEFLIADALDRNADTVVTVGAYQSNFCRVTAAAAALAGLEVHLVLGGSREPQRSGNYLLDQLLGAVIHTVKSDAWDDWESVRADVAETLRHRDRRVYEMPIGGSVPLGALGYALAFEELIDDFRRTGINPKQILFASSSGGTHAGLLLGKALNAWTGTITGIGVAKSDGELTEEVRTLAEATASMLGVTIDGGEILVDGSYAGEAYGIPTPETTQAIEYFARKEGIFLDRVYSGKAAAGVLDYMRSGRVGRGEDLVFIHTGGTPELFS